MKTKTLIAAASLVFGLNAFAVDDSANRTFPTPQSAEGSYAAHVGILDGYVDQNGVYKPTMGYGVSAGFQPYVPLGVGVEYLYYKSPIDVGPGQVGLKRNQILLYGTYNFGGDSIWTKYAYLGAKAGVVINQAYFEPTGGDSTDVGSSFTRFALGPVIGFDAPIVNHLTLGASGTYLFVTGPEKSMDTLEVLAALKYWF